MIVPAANGKCHGRFFWVGRNGKMCALGYMQKKPDQNFFGWEEKLVVSKMHRRWMGYGEAEGVSPFFPCPYNLASVIKQDQSQHTYEIMRCLLFSWMPKNSSC